MPRATARQRREVLALEYCINPWETQAVAAKLQGILSALEVPLIDAGARVELRKALYRRDTFGGGKGSEHVTLVLRTILESEGNENALIAPVVRAVGSAMRPEWTDRGLAWIEAFDQLPLMQIVETMRSLDLFSEQNLDRYFGMVLHNKLAKIFAPLPEIQKPKPARPPRGKRARAAGSAA